MTSLETLSAGTSSTSRSSDSAADDRNWFWAVHNNELATVNSLLSRGADVNAIASVSESAGCLRAVFEIGRFMST
jgi:hypothetical protein